MPNGQIHYKYYKRGFFVIFPASIVLCFVSFYTGIGTFLGYIFHRWCDNDWDLMGASASEGRMVNELPVIGHFLFGISSSYGSIFRRYHRRFITHFPFFSTLIRMLFIGLPVFFILKSFDFDFMQKWFQMFVLSFWIGLSLADSLHYVLDMIWGD